MENKDRKIPSLDIRLKALMDEFRNGREWDSTCVEVLDLIRRPIATFLRTAGVPVPCEATMEDLSQVFCIEFWKRGKKFDPTRGSVLSFAFAMARNVKCDYFRKQGNKAEHNQQLADECQIAHGGDLEQEVNARATLERIHALVFSECTYDNQKIFILYFHEELSAREIAQHLGLSEAAVEGRIRTLRKRFRQYAT